MAARPQILGPHQRRIVNALSDGLMQRHALMKKSGIPSAKFGPALQRLRARGVVHVTKGTRTAADGEVFLKQKGFKVTPAMYAQARGIVLSRIYRGGHGAHR